MEVKGKGKFRLRRYQLRQSIKKLYLPEEQKTKLAALIHQDITEEEFATLHAFVKGQRKRQRMEQVGAADIIKAWSDVLLAKQPSPTERA